MASKAAVRSDIANQILQNDDLTTATIRRHIMQLAWPSLIEMCLTSLMSLVDQLMVARLGASAVSAVGVTQQPVLLMMVIFQAFNVGGTALASRFIGQRDPDGARTKTKPWQRQIKVVQAKENPSRKAGEFLLFADFQQLRKNHDREQQNTKYGKH